jgi:hypothetical protein
MPSDATRVGSTVVDFEVIVTEDFEVIVTENDTADNAL